MQEKDSYDRLQKLEHNQHIIAIIFICMGCLTISFMAFAFIWPDMLFGTLADLNWVNGAGPLDFSLHILQALFYGILWAGLFFLMLAVRLLSIPIALFIGIPSLVGGIALLKKRNGAIGLYTSNYYIPAHIPIGYIIGFLLSGFITNSGNIISN